VLERFEEGTTSEGACIGGHELKTASRGVDGGGPDENDSATVHEKPPCTRRRAAIHDAIDRRVFPLVLEGEVRVPTLHLFDTGQFADDLHTGTIAFDEPLKSTVEFGHGEDRFAARGRLGKRRCVALLGLGAAGPALGG
jgi:hypothetical protein